MHLIVEIKREKYHLFDVTLVISLPMSLQRHDAHPTHKEKQKFN